MVRVAGTRVTLDTVIAAYLEGCTADDIVDQYPSLGEADVYSTIAFYLRHREEVDAHLAENARASEAVRQANDLRDDPTGIRSRLEARRHRR